MIESQEQTSSRAALHAIVLCGFLTALGVGVVSFMLPLVSLDAKISGGWLGTGFAGFFFARLLAGPLGGWWADRFTSRTPLLLASALGACVPFLYFVEPSISILYTIQFFLGVSSGLFRPVSMTVLGCMGKEQELYGWFSLHALAFNGALFVGPVLAGFILLGSEVQPLLWVTSGCMAVAFAMVFWFVPAQKTAERSLTDTNKSMSPFSSLLLALFGRSLGIGLTVAFYPILLAMKVGHDGLLIGLLYSVPGLAVCVGLILLRRSGEKSDKASVIGLLLSAMSLFSVGLCEQVWQFTLVGLFMGVGSALSLPGTMRMASATLKQQGKVFGATHIATGLGFILGPLLGGLIVQFVHDAGLAFMILGVVEWLLCLGMVPWGWLKSGAKSGRLLARESILVVGIVALLILGVSQERRDSFDDGLYRYTEIAMGTVVNITLDARSQKAADDAARKAMSYIRAVQSDLDFRPVDGSVGRINRAAGKHFVKPSDRAYALIRRATAFSELSGGVFDPTIGALTTSPLYYVLDESVAESKKELVDYRLISFDDEGKRIRLEREGMALDLGGIAKGTIIDGTVKVLRGQGITAGIVEAGGDFYCFGDRDWTIGIRHPRADDVHMTVTVREQGVCGSGDYEQYVKVDDENDASMRHHIIDPVDMAPATESIGVTVIAQSAELADALATTVFILGADRGRAFMGDHFPGVSGMWFMPDEGVKTTDNFPQ